MHLPQTAEVVGIQAQDEALLLNRSHLQEITQMPLAGNRMT